MDVEDTICAIASAAGGAARGIVRITGPRLDRCLTEVWQHAEQQLGATRTASRRSGSWRLPSPWGEIPADVMIWPTARSYTRQPTAEVQVIGSPPLLQAMVHDLCRRGVRLARPGEFTLRAFLAGRLDLAQAEAVLGVIDAVDQRQLDVALTQLAGNLSGQLQAIRNTLLNLCADVEAGLDFADEHITLIEPVMIDQILTTTRLELQQLSQQMHTRRQTEERFRVVLQGRPNVGKSTLWNAMLQRDAAIVSAQPGTTRDYLVGSWTWNDVQCQLVDTAGVDAMLDCPLDAKAQQFAVQQSDQADIVVLCLDLTQSPSVWDWERLSATPGPDLVVWTKADQADERTFLARCPVKTTIQRPSATSRRLDWSIERTSNASQGPGRPLPVCVVSGVTGAGLDELRHALRERLIELKTETSGVVSSTATRCALSLEEAIDALARARELAFAEERHELLAAEIRQSLDAIGTMVGAVYTEDILDRVFSRFCIGK